MTRPRRSPLDLDPGAMADLFDADAPVEFDEDPDGPGVDPVTVAELVVNVDAACIEVARIVREGAGPAYIAAEAPEELRLPAFRALAVWNTQQGEVCEHLTDHAHAVPAFGFAFAPDRLACPACASDAFGDLEGLDYRCHRCGAPTEQGVTVVAAHVAHVTPLCLEHLGPYASAVLPAPPA